MLARRNALMRQPLRVFEDFFCSFDDLLSRSETVHDFEVDIKNEGDNVVVRADLPGISKDDLNVTIENRVLTITGERKRESEQQDENYYLCERSSGSYSRSFRVPADVDEQSINATLRDGVLQLILKRLPETKPHKIDIS
ncbi:MAG: Hsp20/alpha crystallin family protein [Promethearchaeota archaeon]|jgi:HSP20 family protein